MMKAQLEKRLTDLKSEFEAGQQMLADLEKKRTELQNTLLRISGAMQVIKELLNMDQMERPETDNREREQEKRPETDNDASDNKKSE